MSPSQYARRRLLGLAALQTASGLGLAAISAAGGRAAGDLPRAATRQAESATERAHWPVVVVGTGYGSAVTAKRLADAGHEVLMIEMGRAWNTPGRDGRVFCKTLQPDGRAMWFKRRTEAPISSVFGLPVVDRPILGHLAVAKIAERATLTYDAERDRIGSTWQRGDDAGAIRALRRVMGPMNRRFRTAYRSDLFSGGRVSADDFCYHPLGGCVLGQATDLHGRLPGHAGLYVNDGALLPGSVGVNPFVTITAIAERNVAEAILPDLAP